MIDRDISYAHWKRTKNIIDFNNYKRFRNRVTHFINTAKSNHLASSNSNKDLWHKLKQINVRNGSDHLVENE